MPEKFVAEVLHVAGPCDLAVLTVKDERFWKGKTVLNLTEDLPQLDENVTCVGYPIGGENISVTRGVVSRIDMNEEILRVQIDAAINPGNSGGPVFNSSNQVIGMARATLKNATNIGYIIPALLIRLFLTATESSGKYMGWSSLWIPYIQSLENPCLRARLKLGPQHAGGIRIRTVEPLGPCAGKVQMNDVLLAVDGTVIARDATVRLRGDERISDLYLVTRKPVGSKVHLKLLRDGVEIEEEVVATTPRYLVPRYAGFDINPSYFICGGLVFVPLSRPWAKEAKKDRIADSFCGFLKKEGQQIVILSKVLAHKVNFGYHNLGAEVLRTFNGHQIHNLSHLKYLVDHCKEDYYEFSFRRTVDDIENPTQAPVLVVLDANECKSTASDILSQHMIQSDCLISEPCPKYVPLKEE